MARAEYNRYRRQGKHELAGAVKAIATGAIWTRQMKHEAHDVASPNCKLCRGQVPDTLRHWVEQCVGNDSVSELADHQEILLQANANWDQAPVLYGRGIIPSGLLPEVATNEDPKPVASGTQYGDWTPDTRDAGWVTVFGDASMEATLPAALRRVGCAIVQRPWMTCQIVAMRGEVLTGPRQEVGRGELWAFLMALRSTAHNLIYVCDRKSVYDGWHGQAWMARHLEDVDLWRQVP